MPWQPPSLRQSSACRSQLHTFIHPLRNVHRLTHLEPCSGQISISRTSTACPLGTLLEILWNFQVVNLASGVVEPPIAGVTDPQGIAMAPDGQRAYVSAGDNVVSGVVPIDLTTGRALAPIAVDSPSTGYLAGPIAVSPEGRTVYTTNLESGYGSAQVSILSTASNKLIARLGGFSGPSWHRVGRPYPHAVRVECGPFARWGNL